MTLFWLGFPQKSRSPERVSGLFSMKNALLRVAASPCQFEFPKRVGKRLCHSGPRKTVPRIRARRPFVAVEHSQPRARVALEHRQAQQPRAVPFALLRRQNIDFLSGSPHGDNAHCLAVIQDEPPFPRASFAWRYAVWRAEVWAAAKASSRKARRDSCQEQNPRPSGFRV